jgi:hydroxymethylbilane synthase
MARPVTIGTRGSRLALVQAEAVADALRRVVPEVEVRLEIISTEGDRVQAGPLPSWGRGVFVREIELALLRGEVDLAVHSLKDVPAEEPDGLKIVAVPERAEPGDVLVTAGGLSLDDLSAGARVGTSSLRRTAFLRAYRPDLTYLPVRGNVDTRWRKLLDPRQGYDALVLAAAGLERLGLAEAARVAIPFAILLPAPGQGALGLQARADDTATCAIVAKIEHPPTAAAVAAERRVLRDLEGGCRLPVAALATPQSDGGLVLQAAVASPDGAQVIRQEVRGTLAGAGALGAEAADRLRQMGAADLLRAAELLEARV